MVTDIGLLLQPIVAVVVAPLWGALVALAVVPLHRRAAGWVSAGAAGVTVLLALALFGQAWSSPVTFSNPLPWWPLSPAPPTFYADVFGASLVLLVSVLGLCLLASSCDPITLPEVGTAHFPLALATLGTTIPLVLSGDLVTFYASWELTTIFVVLILLTRFDERSAAAASRFLFSSLALSTLTFFAVVWTGLVAGSFHFSALGRMAGLVVPEVRWLITAALVGTALFRGAILPFHVWMSKALSAAQPHVASFLFVVLPTTGLLAMVRLVLPHLPLATEWNNVVAGLGLLTALSGSAAALRPREPSSILTYLCVGQAGFVAVGLGIGHPLGVAAASFQLFSFAVSLTLLRLALGSQVALLGQMSLDHWRRSAVTHRADFIAVAVALLSVAGLPPLSGYSARMLLVASLAGVGSTTYLVVLAGVFVATAFGFAAVARLVLDPQCRAAPDVPHHSSSYWNRIPLVTLAAASVLLGLPSHWLSTEFFARLAVDSLSVPLQAVQASIAPWTFAVAAVLIFASLGLGVVIHVARSDVEEIESIPALALVRKHTRRLSVLSPLASRYWQLADKGAFDIYPAISSFLGGFARVAAFVVYVSAGRSAR